MQSTSLQPLVLHKYQRLEDVGQLTSSSGGAFVRYDNPLKCSDLLLYIFSMLDLLSLRSCSQVCRFFANTFRRIENYKHVLPQLQLLCIKINEILLDSFFQSANSNYFGNDLELNLRTFFNHQEQSLLLPVINRYPFIRGLHIHGSDDFFGFLLENVLLKTSQLRNLTIERTPQAQSLSPKVWVHLTNLQKLVISQRAPLARNTISHLTALTHLDLTSFQTQRGVQFLQELTRLTQLVFLRLSNVEEEHYEIPPLTGLLPRLREVKLGLRINYKIFLHSLLENSTLTRLSLACDTNLMLDTSFFHFTHTQALQQITRLSTVKNEILFLDDFDVLSLVSHLPRLVEFQGFTSCVEGNPHRFTNLTRLTLFEPDRFEFLKPELFPHLVSLKVTAGLDTFDNPTTIARIKQQFGLSLSRPKVHDVMQAIYCNKIHFFLEMLPLITAKEVKTILALGRVEMLKGLISKNEKALKLFDDDLFSTPLLFVLECWLRVKTGATHCPAFEQYHTAYNQTRQQVAFHALCTDDSEDEFEEEEGFEEARQSLMACYKEIVLLLLICGASVTTLTKADKSVSHYLQELDEPTLQPFLEAALKKELRS